MKVYYENDADLSLLKNKTVAIIGYGSQGHAHAQNLRDSGVNVIVGQRPGGPNYKLAQEHGFVPVSAREAAEKADLIMILAQDQLQKVIYDNEVKPALTKGKALAFGHGFNIHFGQIKPPADVDVIMCRMGNSERLVKRPFWMSTSESRMALGPVSKRTPPASRLWMSPRFMRCFTLSAGQPHNKARSASGTVT